MAAPTADYKLELADFAFIMPDEITAGKHLWEVKNTGKQFHEMSIIKLNEGVTLEEVIKLMSSQEPPSGPPPYEQIPAGVFMGGGQPVGSPSTSLLVNTQWSAVCPM